MSKRPVLIALMLGGAAALAVSMHAAVESDHSGRTHPAARGWGHHEIDLKEAARHATQEFDRIDSNKDQKISQAELAASGPMRFGHGGHRHRRHHGGPGMGFQPRMHDAPGEGHAPPAFDEETFNEEVPPPDADSTAAGPHSGRGSRHAEIQKAVFARLDADQDGRLTPEEFGNLRTATREAMLTQGFARMDRDSDGALSRSEFPPMQARLQALDVNHDGKVSRDEFPARGHGAGGPQRAAPRS